MSSSPAASTNFPILQDLAATGPHPPLASELATFGRFVGRWAVQVEFYDDAGTLCYRQPGEWSFAWILAGRAIQDVLTYPSPDPLAAGQSIGTSLRSYDARSGKWRVIWIGATSRVIVMLEGGRVGSQIVLEGPDYPGGPLNRWTFADVTPEAFTWTGLESTDGGSTWRLRQRMTASR